MKELAKQWNESHSDLGTATIKSMIDGKFVLLDDSGRIKHATKAMSCLVEPQIGDQVLVVHTTMSSYVLMILTRCHDNSSASAISLDGDVSLSLPNGKLDINAKEGIHLGTPQDLSIIASRFGISGKKMAAAFEKIDLLGSSVEAHLSDVKLFSKRLRSKVEIAMQRFVTRQTNVDSLDSVNAGTIQHTARELLTLKSVFTFMKAKKNVKIDGKQIFMG